MSFDFFALIGITAIQAAGEATLASPSVDPCPHHATTDAMGPPLLPAALHPVSEFAERYVNPSICTTHYLDNLYMNFIVVFSFNHICIPVLN
jgi:hypothetical protein